MTALVVIDIQNDYFPGGAMEVEGSVEASAKTRGLLERFRAKKLPIFHVRHFSVRPGATFLLPDTPGSEIHDVVAPLPGEPVIIKNFPNSFRETDLLARLQKGGITDLVIAGMMSQMCIDATTRAAFDLGFSCTVVHDACAARKVAFAGAVVPAAQVHAAFMAALGAVYARVVSAAEAATGI